MFNEDLKKELEIERANNESLKSQLQLKTFELEQLQKQFEHKNNELADLVSDVFLEFRKITEIATRNDYGQPEQKIRQINEYAETQKNYYAQLELNSSNRAKSNVIRRNPPYSKVRITPIMRSLLTVQ